ncbi:MAG: hypothetical protein ACYTFI_00615 [Planctomycetota bacterium]|jgi:hypothetical protein
MAIQLLGELDYEEAADVLLGILNDARADRYLRAHSARALSKIARKDTLDSLVKIRFSPAVSLLIRGEIKLLRFDRRRSVRALMALLRSTRRIRLKRDMVSFVGSFARKGAALRTVDELRWFPYRDLNEKRTAWRDARAYVQQEFERLAASDEDVSVRATIRRELAYLAGRGIRKQN